MVSMEGVTGIAQRIAAIQTQLGALSPARTSTPPSDSTFALALARAVANAPAAAAPASTAVDADGVPVELAPYGNGRIPAAALHEVGSAGHRLWAPAASSLRQLISDAAREGVTIGVTDSYRSYEAQVDVAKRKGLYSQGGLAAVPGTSDHGWGMAADLELDDTAQSWMRTNAGRYGFVEDTPREPWHWAFQV
ncbi:MAG: M15 family metallopeptidase [Cellulomonas sp.]|nr:M15 family metallopeptidase [Cellulomonas sp.]